MSNFNIFQYENKTIRTAGTTDNPMFCAQDACEILEIKNVSDALSTLDADELVSFKTISGGQHREMLHVTESGLYTLIIKSRKPEAKKFRKWITSEVIPSIRKTGQYSTNPQENDRSLFDKSMDFAKQALYVAENIASQCKDPAVTLAAIEVIQSSIRLAERTSPPPPAPAPYPTYTQQAPPPAPVPRRNDTIIDPHSAKFILNPEPRRYAEEFISDCVTMITNGARPEARRYLRILPTSFSDDGYITRIDIGTNHLWIAAQELHKLYLTECRLLGTSPDNNITAIRRELRKQGCYRSNMNHPRVWKKKLPDDRIARTWWLLDTTRMPETMQSIIHPLH